MAIPLAHEDDMDMSFSEAFGVDDLVEGCFFCESPTRFWHHGSNQPVCPSCATVRVVADLPIPAQKPKDRAPKPLSLEQIELRSQNDVIRATETELRRKLHFLMCDKRTLHKKMAGAKMVIKNPIE